MALRTPPSFLQNGSHPAEQDRLTTQGLFRTSGILSAADLAVTQSTVPAMSVQIAAGWGNIIGTTQANMGAYQYYNDAAATATITTADVTNPRIDLICITINDAYYTGVTNNVAINVVAGTPAASPAVPATPANSYALAQVAVAANATSIVNANITDLRQVVAPVNVAQSVAGKNALINGGMDIWQRGTSNANTINASNFGSDRWQCYSGVAGRTVTQQPSGLNGFKYCLRYQRDSGNAVVTINYLGQNLETVNSIPLTGQAVTLSFWARAGANYSATSNLLGVQLRSGTGTDENALIAGYTGSASIINQNATLTTSWQRFTFTVTVGTTATELASIFYTTPVGTAGANDYFEITGVQLELGSTATTFSRAGGSIGGETALCQRYYATLKTIVEAITLFQGISYPVTMRANPTVAGGGAGFTVSAADVGVGLWYQTTRAQQSLTLNAEL